MGYQKRSPSKRVLIIRDDIKHYRLPLFIGLHEDLSRHNISFRVAYSAPRSMEQLRHDSVDLPSSFGRKVPAVWFLKGKAVLQFCAKEVWEADYIIVEHALKHAINPPLLLLSLLRLKKVAVWVHGGSLKYPKSPFAFRIRTLVAQLADWCFAYTNQVITMLETFGIPRGRCTNLENSMDVESLRKALAEVTPDQLRAVRERFNLPEDAKVAIYCGSLYPGKGISFLIEACGEVKKRVPDFHLLVVGDGAETDTLAAAAATRPWIHHAGAVLGPELAIYLSLARVALKPYLTGLGILDAMTAGLPYIVTEARTFNPEIDYLIDGETGVVTKDTVQSFSEAVVELFNDTSRWERMHTRSMQESTRYTIANMTRNFSQGIQAWIEADSK